MSDFFKYISSADVSSRHVSAMAVSGPHTGQKGLLKNHQWIYTTGAPKVFEALLPLVENLSGTALIRVDDDTFFCETLSDIPRLILCGAGHVSMPIIRLGKMTGFHVTVIDDRPEFCANAQAAGADEIICEPFEKALSALPAKANRYFVVVTRGHQYDIACLQQILSTDFIYAGMMGSKMRTAKVRETLQSMGFSKELTEAVHMPIGLSIKAETPEEIAVSVMSQIILEKNSHNPSYCYSKEMLEALDKGDCALVTILERKGSAPRSAGTKMVVLKDGRCIGTVGGGIAEARITELALSCIKNKTTASYAVDMSGHEAAENGMVCGGHVKVYIEAI